MADTLVITAGTSGSAVGLDFERKRTIESRDIIGLTSLSGHNGAGPVQLPKEGEDYVQVLAFDIDTTGVYMLNPPLNDWVPTWNTGSFIPCRLPGPDLVEHIKAGRHRGRFEYLNGESIRSMEAIENASGGARTNGWLAAEANSERIEHEIRRCFERIITRQHTFARRLDARIRVVVVTGVFGGFGSGSQEVFKRIVRRIARETQVRIDLICLELLPALNRPKDYDNTWAVTHGYLKEFAAYSTGQHWHREKSLRDNSAEQIRTRTTPTIFLSDCNGAPGEPRGLSIENFTGLASEFLYQYLKTDLGARLDALAGDFEIPSQQPTTTGEPRFGRSVGLSLVHLDRQRLYQYAGTKLSELVLSRTLAAAEEENVSRDVRAFFESRRIVQGAGVHQLSDLLLQRGNGEHGFLDIERFREIFHNNTGELSGLDLLNAAAARLQLSIAQSGDLQTALTARRQATVAAVGTAVVEHTELLARSPERGIAAARQFLEEAIMVAEHMAGEANDDTEHYEGEIQRLEQQVNHFQNVYAARVNQKNILYKRFRKSRIKTNAGRYRRLLEDLYVARMQHQAHLAAIDCLNEIAEPLRRRLATVQAALDAATVERDNLNAELSRICEYRPNFSCPVGLALIETPEDLQQFYQRLLPDGDEDRAVNDLHARIFASDLPLSTVSDPARLREELGRGVEQAFLSRIQTLHVVDELRHRFPTQDELGAALRERDRESFEFVQLRDSSDQENGVSLVRLLGVDADRAGDLGDVLNRAGYPRTVPYQVVNVDDPERISFLQFRAVFPISDLAHFNASRAAYMRASAQAPFEKYHVVPGDRSLPEPGRFLTELEARIVALKAWIVGRLEFDALTSNWKLVSADDIEMPVPLGQNLDLLLGEEGYSRSVDVTSYYAGFYFDRGPNAIREKLLHLSAIGPQHSTSSDDDTLRTLIDERAIREIEDELQWWSKNSVPATMEWSAHSSRRNTSAAGLSDLAAAH